MSKSPFDKWTTSMNVGYFEVKIQENLTPLQKAEREVEVLKRTNAEQAAALQRLQTNGCVVGIVVKLREKHAVISIGAQLVEALIPTNLPGGKKIQEGDHVRLLPQPSLQIIEVVEPHELGTVHKVVRTMSGSRVEIESQPCNRVVVSRGLEVEAGDQVVVDATMTCALSAIRSAAKYASRKVAPTRWEQIGGQEAAKRAFREAVEDPYLHRELYEALGKKRSKGILLAGPAGCGKTTLGRAAATAIAEIHGAEPDGGGFLYVKGPEILSRFVGDSEANLRSVFESARAHSRKRGYPAVVFFDECDAIFGERRLAANTSSGMSLTLVPQALVEMDGIEESDAIVVLATNRPENIDSALLRDGRIDAKVRVGRPTREDCAEIARVHLGTSKTEDGAEESALLISHLLFEDDREVARIVTTDGDDVRGRLRDLASGALVAGIVESAKTHAMRRAKGGDSRRYLVAADFELAVDEKEAEARQTARAEDFEELVAPECVASFEVLR